MDSLYFIYKCTKVFTRKDSVETEERIEQYLERTNFNEDSILCFRDLFQTIGITICPFHASEIEQVPLSNSMLLLHPCTKLILPDSFYALSEKTWARIDHVFSKKITLEYAPGKYQDFSYNELSHFSKQSHPFFGFYLTK